MTRQPLSDDAPPALVIVRPPAQTLDRGNASGRATRERLILLAERMFAERGIEGASLRAIGEAAGQRNKTAVQYHFGDRAALVSAIYAYRSEQLDTRRTASLEAHDESGEPDSPKLLLRILVEPYVESIADPDNYFLPFLARLVIDVGGIANESSLAAEPFMGAHNEIRRRIREADRYVSDDVFDLRYGLLITFAITALATHKRFGDASDSTRLTAVADEIVEMMAAGLAAPLLD
ncbi:MAG: TetR/AcrR family transcriptional regulator [Acidimicrobiia bacterium]